MSKFIVSETPKGQFLDKIPKVVSTKNNLGLFFVKNDLNPFLSPFFIKNDLDIQQILKLPESKIL